MLGIREDVEAVDENGEEDKRSSEGVAPSIGEVSLLVGDKFK